MKEDSKKKRQIEGVVISDKMRKTIVVRVDRVKVHPKYKKQYRVRRNYKVHDEKNESHIGDKVLFEECRPISKDKRWRLIKNLSKRENIKETENII